MSRLVCIVCNMQINEKNYDFNKEAFISKNSKDDIKVCPFCGASIEYLKEDGEELKFTGEILNKEELKIIDHAVKLEIFNGNFYEKASIIAKDDKIKKMFANLANIEYMHAKIHKKIGGFKEDPVLREMDYSKYDSDELLLDAAWKREKHAVQYYEKYSKDVESHVIRQVFKALSDVEKEHIELTEV